MCSIVLSAYTYLHEYSIGKMTLLSSFPKILGVYDSGKIHNDPFRMHKDLGLEDKS